MKGQMKKTRITMFMKILLMTMAGLCISLEPYESPGVNISVTTKRTPGTQTERITKSVYSLSPKQRYNLLELNGDTLHHNVLKLFDVAYNKTRKQIYVSGIMTSHVAVYDTTSRTFTGTLDTGFGGQTYKYLKVASSIDSLYVRDADTNLVRIELGTGTIAAFLPGTGAEMDPTLDETRGQILLTRQTSPGLLVLDALTFAEIYTSSLLDGHSGPSLYDPDLDRFYILDIALTAPHGNIQCYDPATRSIDHSIPFNLSSGRALEMLWNTGTQQFFIRASQNILVLDKAGVTLKTIPYPPGILPTRILYDTAHDKIILLALDQPSEGRVAATGVHIFTFPVSTSQVTPEDDISFGHKAHRFDLATETQEIYAVEGDASVIWRIPTSEMDTTSMEAIRLGYSVELLGRVPDSVSVVGTSRLGGSNLFCLNTETGAFKNFTAGTWPIPIRTGKLNNTTPYLLVLNAWDSSLSTFGLDPPGETTLLQTISLGIPDGSTDRLPELAVDWTRNLAYAAYPEFGQIVVCDWLSGITGPVLSLTGFKTGDTGGGPGQLQVIVNETDNLLFVFHTAEKNLHVYDGNNSHVLLSTISLAPLDWVRMQTQATPGTGWFYWDAAQERLFLGPHELSPSDGMPLGSELPLGPQRIFGVDPENNTYWADGGHAFGDKESYNVYILDRDSLQILHEEEIMEFTGPNPDGLLDPENGKLLVSVTNEAAVHVFDIIQPPVAVAQQENGSWVGVPHGTGPFPGVLYNHGGYGPNVGGDLEATVRALAESGYLAYAKTRDPASVSINASLVDVLDGVDELLDLPHLDPEQLTIMGYSRGGLLALRVAQLNPAPFARVIMMAPAPGYIDPVAGSTTMDEYLLPENIELLNDAVAFLLLVASNDKPPDNPNNDFVELAGRVQSTLDTAGWMAEIIIQPSWNSPGSGHDLFKGVDENGQELLLQEGYYWKDVMGFLNAKTPESNAVNWGHFN